MLISRDNLKKSRSHRLSKIQNWTDKLQWVITKSLSKLIDVIDSEFIRIIINACTL